jgi:hypothetical protein
MVEWTYTLLAWPARDLLLEMDRFGVIGLRPGYVRGTKESDNGATECRCKMSRAAVGGNQQIGATDARFRQAQ